VPRCHSAWLRESSAGLARSVSLENHVKRRCKVGSIFVARWFSSDHAVDSLQCRPHRQGQSRRRPDTGQLSSGAYATIVRGRSIPMSHSANSNVIVSRGLCVIAPCFCQSEASITTFVVVAIISILVKLVGIFSGYTMLYSDTVNFLQFTLNASASVRLCWFIIFEGTTSS